MGAFTHTQSNVFKAFDVNINIPSIEEHTPFSSFFNFNFNSSTNSQLSNGYLDNKSLVMHETVFNKIKQTQSKYFNKGEIVKGFFDDVGKDEKDK